MKLNLDTGLSEDEIAQLLDERKKARDGDFNSGAIGALLDAILLSCKPEFDKLWLKYPEMNLMGVNFVNGDVFIGKNFDEVQNEARSNKREGICFDYFLVNRKRRY